MKKKLFIILGVIGLIAIVIAIYFLFFKKEPVITKVTTKDTKEDIVLYGSFINPNDYVSNIENGKLADNELILVDDYPTKDIEITYYDNNKDKRTTKVTLNVVDAEKPIIMNAQNITIKVGEKLDYSHSVMIGDNADRNPKIEIVGDYDTNKIGTYSLKYLVTDEAGNQTEQWFKLNVIGKSNNGSNYSGNYTHQNYNFADFINDYKSNSVKLGIDVSKWQGDINWQKVKNAGCEFALIRIGYQYGKDGELKIDPYFEKNIKEANEAGIPVGLYFASYAYSKEEASKQAKWVIDNIKKYKVDLPISFDWENWTSFSTYHINLLDINQTAEAFIDTINENGYTGMMYSSKSYLEAIWNDFDVTWLAHYTTQTNYTGKYLFWQVSNIGKIDGINGDVDLDIMYK